MVTYNIPTNSHVFVFTEGQLKEINIKKIFFENLCRDKDHLLNEFRIESDRIQGFVRLSDIYDSVEDYLAGKKCSSHSVRPFQPAVFNSWKSANGDFYYIEDNQVKFLNTCEMSTAYYDFERDIFYSEEFKGREFFRTEEDAATFLDVEVNRADGTIERAQGINRLLMLDEDQRELIKQLKDLLAKIKENGIMLYSDTDGEYFAYNTRNVEDIHVDYKDDFDDDSYECSGSCDKHFREGCLIPWHSYEEVVFAKRKK